MYDSGKIIAGIVIFLALITLPFWWQAGKAAAVPDPKLPTEEQFCVEPKEQMRYQHMQILNEWRDSVVRVGDRIYVADNGTRFNMSLVDGCMRCHNDKAKFCDQCHNYLQVNPYCWDCHVAPEPPKEGK